MSKQYGYSDEGSHEPGTTDEDWQEPVFVHWYDRSAGVGGVSRIGHEPNRPGGGRSALQCFVATTDGVRFRCNDYQLPYLEPGSERGFRSGYPLTDFFPPSSSMAQDFAKDHYETSGRIRGSVRIDGRSYDVDGMYHRDHSWGLRKTMTLPPTSTP